MDADQFASLASRLHGHLTRRVGLGALAALSTRAVLTPAPAAGKHKKKKKKTTCPVCPTPPPSEFCAGKNDCAQSGSVSCDASGGLCRCYVRADPTEPFCGDLTTVTLTATCESCAAGTTCVVLGGACVGGYGCVSPCPNPM